ncbi:MAG: alpha/beta fold hydrolase [Prosthecobacter sp.]
MRWPVLLSLLSIASITHADEVIQVSWKTAYAAPPPQFTRPASDYLPVFRLGLAALPESAIVALALSQPDLLGLTPQQAAEMRAPVAERYALIAKSTVYAAVPSALPYCFADKRPSQGLALVHVPAGADAQTPLMVFLHGYGGSFLWYQHLLAEHFPRHVIVCPVHGINTATIPAEYVQECVQAVGAKLGHPTVGPALVGLSAGGTGACDLFVRHPERFDRMVCLASYPPTDLLQKFPQVGKTLFMAGSEEFFVKSGDFMRRVRGVHQQAPGTEGFVVPGAGHFFLLTHVDVTMKRLRAFLEAQ